MRWLLAAWASWTCFCLASVATFLPLRSSGGIEYLYVWPRSGSLVIALAAGFAAFAALYVAVRWLARRRSAAAFDEARRGRWLSPAAAVGVVLLGIAPAVPGVGERGAVAGYFFYDMRWWWCVLLGAWMAWKIDRLLGDPIARRLRAIAKWSPAARLLLLDALLLVGVMGWAWFTSPNLQYDLTISGDEPRYVRYDEVWYQGQGFVVSTKTLMADQRLDSPPAVLRNFALLAGAVGEETRALLADLEAAAADPWGFRWNRARRDGAYVKGKRGGVYEIYQPGLSLLLFPGYFLDRYLLGLTPGYQAEFPADLMMTRLTMLFICGACAVALFRLLRHALTSDALAFGWAALAMMMLPMSAFAMQFYPELPASLLLICVSNFVCFHAATSQKSTAALAGAGAAALLWFHPRFIVISLLLFAVGIVTTRRTSRGARAMFVGSYALIACSLAAFDYRITGSFMPDALWSAPGAEDTFGASSIVVNLVAYALHRMWGLAPHALVLLGVLPGLVVLGRRSSKEAAFVLAMGLALGIPAAGHTLSGGGTTVGRLVVAVVPLFIWPVSVLVRRFWASGAMRAATIIAIALTLDAALAYNLHDERGVGSLHGPTDSGWRPNLAFPLIRDNGAESAPWNIVWLWTTIAFIVGLTVIAFLRSRRAPIAPGRANRPPWRIAAGAIVVFLVIATAGTAATGSWTRGDFLTDDRAARIEAAQALISLERCRVCFTSRRPQVDWTWLRPNPIRDLAVHLDFGKRLVIAHLDVEPAGQPRGFGRMHVDFGDGTPGVSTGIMNRADLSHTYAHGGTFRLEVSLQLPNGERRLSAYNVVLD